MYAISLSPSSTATVNSRAFGATFSSAAMPSGAATTHNTVISAAPRLCSRPMVCFSDPPVASMGSSTITGSAGTGTLLVQDTTHLHGPLDLALSPNGHLLAANSDGRNADPNQPSELVEYSTGGKFLTEFSVDPNNGGAFGLTIHSLGNGVIRYAAVDYNQNTLNMWTIVLPRQYD